MKKLPLFLLFILSCSNGPEAIVYPPGSVQPVVTGIIITDSEGNDIGIWGNPGYSLIAYPNPTMDRTTIIYNVPKRSRVLISAVKARLINELSDNLFNTLGEKSYIIANNSNKILLDKDLPAGRYFMEFKVSEPGFYRVNFIIDDSFYWVDVLIFAESPSYIEFFENIYY